MMLRTRLYIYDKYYKKKLRGEEYSLLRPVKVIKNVD